MPWRLCLGVGCVFLIPDFKELLAANLGVVLQNIHAVDAGDGKHGVAFIIKRAFAVLALNHCQLAAQDLCEECTFSASRFQKPGVYALRFLLYKVAHRLYFPLICENLAVIGYSLFGLDLFFRHPIAPSVW